MSTSTDPRHAHRQTLVQELFSYSFHEQEVSDETLEVLKKTANIDPHIEKAAPAWPLDKLNKADLAILRLAIYELMEKTDIPPKVVIDEAVELAKDFGGENSPSFVNGVLGTILKELYPEGTQTTEEKVTETHDE